MSNNYSGSPIFPAEEPYGAPQQPAWPDAEPTALIPPVPPVPPQPQGWDGAQPPPSSNFSRIHEKYATTEVPLPPQQSFPQQGYAPQPQQGYEPPQQGYEPQQGYQPQPADPGWPEHWAQPQPVWSEAEPTTLLPPVPSAPSAPPGYAAPPPGYPEPPAPGAPAWPDASGWPDAPLAQGAPGSLREAFAAAQPTGPAVAPGPGFQPPTAPAGRTGSPIVDPGIQPAAATLAIAVLLAVAALLGRFGLVLPVLLLQAVTAAGWFRLNGMWPARQGIALAGLGGLTADAAALAASGGTAPAVLAGTLGGFFLLVLILQTFKPSNPDERFYALTVTASATVMTLLAGCFLAAGTLHGHGWSTGAAVVLGALAAGAATAVSALPVLKARLGFAAGAGAGTALGALLGAVTGLGLGGGLLLGLAAGACALVGRRVAAYDFPSRFVHLTAGVALPLACAAPATFLVGHLLAR